MSSKIMLSLATVALFAATASADTTVETTKDWFTVDASEEEFESGWSGSESRSVVGGLIKVDTKFESPAIYTPATAPSATRYRVSGSMKVTLNAAVPANNVFGATVPKAALVAVEGDPNKWYGWNGDSWEDLSEGITAAPSEDHAAYDIAIEFFVENSELKIKYVVGSESKTLTHVSATTLPTLTQVWLAGYGSFGDFGAVGYEEFEFVVADDPNPGNPTELPQYNALTESGYYKAKEKAPSLSVADFLADKGSNGLPNWQNYVLGLDSTDENAKPFAAPEQNSSSDKLTFNLGGVNINSISTSDATVTYTVEIASSINGAATFTSDETAAGSPVELYLTDNGQAVTEENQAFSGVRYYRIKVKIQQ